ncbi:MAG: serine/threonine protein kinase [Actinomycetota bacterium]
MTPKTPAPATGDVLGDRYMLKREQWTTPLGPVWLARDRVLDRAVFLQLLAPTFASDRPTRHAFEKAAARIAQIGAPGLLQVYDIGDEPPFAVLEHASGGRLAERLNAGPMRPTEVARAALAIARALEALHERGTWHGALSPNTVLFDEEGRAKVFSVGVSETARQAGKVQADADQPASYHTPEKDPIPADADRYALAALTYQMLTGNPPEPGVSARMKRRSVPPEMDELLSRALAPDPTVRPSLDEFEGALAPFARVLPSDVKEPRLALAEFRWLVPVIVIVGLAIAALTVGVQVASHFSKNKASPKPTTSARAPTNALAVSSVRDFDPLGNGKEHPDQARLAIDGSQLTKWSTEDYKTANLGGKKGVGLLFDLGSRQAIGSVQIQSSLTGWSADVRVADTEGTDPASYVTVATVSVTSNDVTFSLKSGTSARYVLLWITRLGPNQSDPTYPYSAEVNEVRFFAP